MIKVKKGLDQFDNDNFKLSLKKTFDVKEHTC